MERSWDRSLLKFVLHSWLDAAECEQEKRCEQLKLRREALKESLKLNLEAVTVNSR